MPGSQQGLFGRQELIKYNDRYEFFRKMMMKLG